MGMGDGKVVQTLEYSDFNVIKSQRFTYYQPCPEMDNFILTYVARLSSCQFIAVNLTHSKGKRNSDS